MIFNLIFFIYIILYFPYLLLSGRWYKGYGCRLGFFPKQLINRLVSASSIWIHAVSVGEVMAISSLVARIKSRWPKQTLVITVTTKTGYELAQEKLSREAVIIPSPIDLTWVVESFIRLINPKIYIAAETEIWPNLFNSLSRRKISIAIINGRISDASYGRYKAIKFLLQRTLKQVSLFCMQSQEDARRILELGAPQERVGVAGNVKFDDSLTQQQPQVSVSGNFPLWVAGSTHPGEEEIILNVFTKYKDSWGLVIAPRHVQRSEQIVRLVESQGLKAVLFSKSSILPSLGTVLVVDTIGHLRQFYAQASLVFVGKSLCVGGGHNIIEPAVYAKPMIIGPLMQNFRDITALFKAQGALVQVNDIQEFERKVHQLMGDENLRKQLGQKAYKVVKDNQGATERTLKALGPLL